MMLIHSPSPASSGRVPGEIELITDELLDTMELDATHMFSSSSGGITRVRGQRDNLERMLSRDPKLHTEYMESLEHYASGAASFSFGGRRMKTEPFRIMGILNVTPDSFSDGGLYFRKEDAVAHAMKMADEGADIIDVGGESTRPGAVPVSVEEELRRVIPVIRELVPALDIPVSVDTRHPEVADEALKSGALILNDISGLSSSRMRKLCVEYGCGAIIMHMQGEPRTMQSDPSYRDVTLEVASFLSQRVNEALSEGMQEEALVVDPGIGFGKTVAHNMQLIEELDALKVLGRPILTGVSRKSFIRKIAGEGMQRLEGSLAAAILSLARGASIFRVHDVAPTLNALKVADAILQICKR